ncbi:thioredoxin family protein [Kamptonema cortianum]|nr:thioredoxin family protein [Geitlerinema splendidum]MDK3157674.1 thioredoxin family protein [Kamptonema cortianum]
MISIPIFIAVFVGSNMAPENNWLTDYSQAKSKSAETGKPILAFFTGSDWCGWCEKLKSEVLDTVPFRRWAAEKMVLLELDFPKTKVQAEPLAKQNRQLAEQLQIGSFPTIVYLDKHGHELARTGYLEQRGPWPWIKNSEKILAESSHHEH